MESNVLYFLVSGGRKIASSLLIFPFAQTENSIHMVFFSIRHRWKIASGLLTFPFLGTENSALSTNFRPHGRKIVSACSFFRPWQTEKSLTFAYFSVCHGWKITPSLIQALVITCRRNTAHAYYCEYTEV